MSADVLMTTTSHLILICCNGGFPFVDLDVGLGPGHDLTDWVASDRSLTSFLADHDITGDNATDIDLLQIAALPNRDSCEVFNLTFTTRHLSEMYATHDGSLRCRCPRGVLGDLCELEASALTLVTASAPTSPRRMFFLLIPLLFIVFALVGAFSIKFFLHDLPAMKSLCCVGKDDCYLEGQTMSHPAMRNANDFAVDTEYEQSRSIGRKKSSLSDPLPQETVNHLIAKAQQSKYGAPSAAHRQPGAAHNHVEGQGLLPTITQTCQPVDYPVYTPTVMSSAPRYVSPPPSYRSLEGERTPPRQLGSYC